MRLSEWNPELEESVRRWADLWGRRLGVSNEDRLDLAQDAVCRAYSAISEGKVSGEDILWVLVRNSAIDFKRKMVAKVYELDDRDGGGVVPNVDRVAIESIASEFPELVALARARDAGYEWEIIAQEMGMTVGQIRQRWKRMVAQVSVAFSEESIRDLSHLRG